MVTSFETNWKSRFVNLLSYYFIIIPIIVLVQVLFMYYIGNSIKKSKDAQY